MRRTADGSLAPAQGGTPAVTEKGKGYAPAVKNKENWHYCAPFNIETGKPTVDFGGENYSDITAEFLLDKMAKDKKVVAITSAVPTSMGFDKARRDKAGSQFVDVGIAEEHAVALASGIAKNGGKPVYGTYSTFIQRTYDQIAQDLCLNSEPATIVLYGASVFGMNDAGHIGYYDIPMLSNILNLIYLAPTCKEEYLAMLDWSIEQNEYPVAIRVPENGVVITGREFDKDYGDLNKYQITQSGSDIAIIALGSFYRLGEEAAKEIESKTGKKPTLINPRFITGTDDALLSDLMKEHSVVVTLEDGVLDGGFGEKIARFYGRDNVKVLNYGLKKEFEDRYDHNALLVENRLTKEQIAEDVCGLLD